MAFSKKVVTGFRRLMAIAIIAATSLSILSLIDLGFRPDGWWPPIQLVMDAWRGLIAALTGWTELPLRSALGWVATYRNLPREAYPFAHWPHALFVDGVLFGLLHWGMTWRASEFFSITPILLVTGFVVISGLSFATFPPYGAFVATEGLLISMALFGVAFLVLGTFTRNPALQTGGWIIVCSLMVAGIMVLASPGLTPLGPCEFCSSYRLAELSEWLWSSSATHEG